MTIGSNYEKEHLQDSHTIQEGGALVKVPPRLVVLWSKSGDLEIKHYNDKNDDDISYYVYAATSNAFICFGLDSRKR